MISLYEKANEKTLEKLNFEGPSSVQSAAWPATQRNLSFAAIAPPHSGKTVGYLLPIVSNFLNEVYEDLPKTKGPVAIIICSSWKKVFAVQDLLNLFLDGFKLKILTCFADGTRKRNRIKESIRMFSAKSKRDNEQQIPLQIVINSERWTNSIASFVDKCMKNPVVLFTSYLEAAIQAQIPILAHVCNESEKDNRLLDLIKANEGKTVVCTKDMDKALLIHSFLKSESVRSFLITEEMEHYISEGIIQDWKSVNSHLPYCLISTDSALTGKIKGADCIIHYDVPEMSRLQFGYRFGCMTEHFIKQDTSKCESHILLSETCYSQAKALMKIIKRTGKKISKEMLDLVIKQEKIQCPPDVPLCHYFKAFGKCKLPICTKRHYISSASDKPNIVPNEGDVHAMVTHVFDATHFYVKILRYLPPDGEQLLSMSCEYAKLCSNLRKYYSVESNRKVVKDPVVGVNYIIRDSNKLAYRVKVLDLLNPTETECQKITLLYRDEGLIRSYDHWELFEDIDFGCLPSPHAVEVYLCNVCTPDSCPEWNSQANIFVKKLVLNKEIHGKIALCLGETLFLHPFALREKMKFVDDYINILSVESSLINDGFARENKKHIEILKSACTNKIPLPNIKKTNPPPENATEFKPEISYAFLEMNVYEDVYVSSVISPQQVYVQRVKFVKCLEELLEKINAKVTAGKVKKCSTLLNGMHCIAPFDEDNRYYRAVVTNVSPDDDDVQLFFVDFGDSCYSPKDSIYDLSPDFMLLPFQAIECELDGINAPHGGWSDKGIEYLTDLTKDEEGCMKILEIKAYTKLICYDAGNRYKVDIWNSEKTLSEQLLEEGLANPGEKSVPSEISVETVDKEFDENIPSGYAASTSDDDDVPSENKYHHSLFCIALAKMMMEGMSNSEAAAEAKREMSEKMEQKEDGDDADKISDIVKTQEFPELENNVKLTSPVLALQRLLRHTQKKNKIKERKPKISWWDSAKYVYILVKLKDVQIYELNVQDHFFTFKTSHKGSDYFIEEEFYSLIFSKNFEIKNEPEGLRLILEKQENLRWPHLTKQNVKVPYIKYDLNHIDDSDCEDSFQESIPTRHSPNADEAREIGIDDPASDEDSDDDYLMPWQKFAQFKDPYALLD
ncbi:putative ATP-dependent RNA helicase TDRD12 [Trichonephila clavipes]|nr:putative ATP-dependent RNA helicase TDRD12 [Trichonephila clavipes]